MTATGRSAMMSTARLIENMNRLGVSIGSQTSAAPVSLTAQPPIRVAATVIATSERCAFRFIVPDRLLTINTTLVHPAGPDTLGPKARSGVGPPLFRRSVAHVRSGLK